MASTNVPSWVELEAASAALNAAIEPVIPSRIACRGGCSLTKIILPALVNDRAPNCTESATKRVVLLN